MSTLNVTTVAATNIRASSVQDTGGGNSSTPTEIKNGIAKAWVNFNGTGTVAIRASFNVSIITDNGTGDYTVNFTTAFANVDYSSLLSGGTPLEVPNMGLNCTGGVANDSPPTTTSFRFFVNNAANTAQIDCKYVTAAIFR